MIDRLHYIVYIIGINSLIYTKKEQDGVKIFLDGSTKLASILKNKISRSA